MYPLAAVLVGCDDAHHPELRQELAEQGIKIENEFPNAARAIAELSVSPRDQRFFLFQVTPTTDCRQLERLNDAFLGRPIVALVDGQSDPGLTVQAMRAGAAQVVTLPLRVDDFKDALQRVARQFGYSLNATRVIAISGVTEGCGATTIAINLAAEIAARHHLPALLVELSLHLGRLASILDLNPGYTTHDLLTDIDRLDIELVQQALVRVGDNFHVLAGPHTGIPNLKPTPEQVLRLVDYARRLAQVVILDMPYTYDDVYFRTLAAADHVVLVTEQTVPSLQALKTLRGTLEQIEGLGHLSVVLNRYDSRRKDFRLDHVRELLQVPNLYPVAADVLHCTDALNSGHTLRQESPSSATLVGIDALADALLGKRTVRQRRGWRLPAFLRHLIPGSV